MARSFRSADARRVIREQLDIVNRLEAAENGLLGYREAVLKCSEALVDRQVLQILKNIPIEEINRDKHGIRVKNLREAGYLTIADLASASVYSLAAIDGISEDGAYTIKKLEKDIVAKARWGVKIRLTADDQSEEASALILALSQYRQWRPLAIRCRQLAEENKFSVSRATADAAPGTGGLRWLFASKARKQQATEAYNYLESLTDTEYYHNATEVLAALDQIEHLTRAHAWQDFSANSVAFFNALEEIDPGVLGNNDTVYGLPEDLARDIQDQAFFPDGLLCQLRRYQEWGVKYILHQGRVLLGDEMGLGKTIQAIAAMVSLKSTGETHFVVVCPASVITNWCREIQKMSRLSVTKVHGNSKEAALQSWLQSGGVAVTTYETTASFQLPENFKFAMLVVDEAHYIKNPEAQRTVHVKALCAHSPRLLFMTGTALENRVDEMVALIGILQPGIARQTRGLEMLAEAPQFRRLVAPVYYRRRREDVLTELPELIESKEWCNMTPQEEKVYERAVLTGDYPAARQVSWNVDDLQYSSKAKRLLELVEEAESDGRKIIVFSFFLDTIRKVTALLGDRCTNPINGSVTPQRRQEIIDEFDKAPAGTVLPAQIQSGGTGLNIQSASVVILCEPQFKPSTENQAISRAYRMGQTRNVLVYRLLCDETVDEKILVTLEGKQAIFDAFADESEAARESLELDNTTFGSIIKEEIDRINAKNGKG